MPSECMLFHRKRLIFGEALPRPRGSPAPTPRKSCPDPTEVRASQKCLLMLKSSGCSGNREKSRAFFGEKSPSRVAKGVSRIRCCKLKSERVGVPESKTKRKASDSQRCVKSPRRVAGRVPRLFICFCTIRASELRAPGPKSVTENKGELHSFRDFRAQNTIREQKKGAGERG